MHFRQCGQQPRWLVMLVYNAVPCSEKPRSMYRGNFRAVLESATLAEEIARVANAKSELTEALWMKGWGWFNLGDVATALPLSEQVLALSTELNIGHRWRGH